MKKFVLIIALVLSANAQASGDFLMALGALHTLTNIGSVANGGESRPFLLPKRESEEVKINSHRFGSIGYDTIRSNGRETRCTTHYFGSLAETTCH